jgi:hypothetical protein
MKTKTEHHHHKAADNALTRAWTGVVERFKGPQGRTYWLLLSVVVLVAVLIGVWIYFAFNSASVSSDLWTQAAKLSAADELEAFAKAHAGTPQARFAQLKAARSYMLDVDALAGAGSIGGPGAPPTRREAVEHVRKARDLYDAVANESGVESPFLQQALLGAGKASEVLGELDKAKTYYDRLAADKPETALVKEAHDRAEWLATDTQQKDEMEYLAKQYAKP